MAFGKWTNNATTWSDGNVLYADDLNAIGDAIPPIGGIIAWAKSMTSVPQTLPAAYIECDGSTISDSDSPMNGEDVPDLISAAQRFLRGNTTSGGTGGSATTTLSPLAVGGGSGATPADDGTFTNEPPYYDVVWVMRIK